VLTTAKFRPVPALCLALALGLTLTLSGCPGSTYSTYGPMGNNQLPAKGGPPYTVTYANTTVNTTGGVPVDSTLYASGSTVTVLGNTGNLSWPPFVFVGWDSADLGGDGGGGGGTFYAPGATFTITSNVVLFGTWNP
jgi:hypothetical protein